MAAPRPLLRIITAIVAEQHVGIGFEEVRTIRSIPRKAAIISAVILPVFLSRAASAARSPALRRGRC